jgi:suppressor for copper-sensitivity B
MKKVRSVLPCAWVLCAIANHVAGAGAFPLGGIASADKEPIAFQVLLDRESVAPGGSFRVAVMLVIENGWYAYANPLGPGFGSPTVVTGKDQPGFTFSPARYLPGKQKSQDDIEPGKYVLTYAGKVPVFLEVGVGKDVKPGAYTLAARAEGQTCSTMCLLFKQEVTFTITVAEGTGEPKKANEAVFADFDKAVPAAATGPKVEPPTGGGESDEAAIDISKYEGRTLSPGVTGFLMAIIFGFIAGVLLNVMPCVLPVIGIKIMSLVAQAHEERGRVFRLGLAFGAGVMVVFLILATLAAVAGKSWGDQFQSEAFLLVMLSVVFVFALGLFDVYIILVSAGGGASVSQEGYLGSFLKGVLATFLATPCSGPFLGATLAWALSQPPVTIFVVFTSIGLGMAAPYVLLAASPGLLRFVPKPGAWMETFKHLMGFLLLGTVVYLFTLLRHELVGPTLVFCLVLALCAYLFGRYAHGAVPVARRWVWRAALVILVAAGAYACFKPDSKERIAWEPFTLTALDMYQIQGKNVLVDFTADWCPNCKFVERFVLESGTVRAALAKKNVVLLKADITRATAESSSMRMMQQLGSRSIPFLAIFPADDHFKPYTLRDIYAKSSVLSILERCPDA